MARAKEQPYVARPSSSHLSGRLLVGLGIAVGVVGLVAVGGLAYGLSTAQSFRRSQVIAPRVRIQGIDVGGLTASEAENRVRSAWADALPKTLRLIGDGGTWDVDRRQLGLRLGIDKAIAQAQAVGRSGSIWSSLTALAATWRPDTDLQVPVEVDSGVLASAMRSLAKIVDRAPADARVQITDGQVVVVPEKTGRSLDVDASEDAVAAALKNTTSTEAELTVSVAQPEVKTYDLRDLNTTLSSFTTHFNSGEANRSHNLRLGITILNGTVVLPGQVCSLNETLGPRSVARGFEAAPTFVGHEVLDTPGGGVCQIASTLYNAVLLAGLEVTQREHHSRPVPYVLAGRDATISYGGPDLKFRNNLSHAILVLGSVSGEHMTVAIVGASEDKVSVELKRSGIETIPAGRKEVQDPTLPPGGKVVDQRARNGLKVTVTRIITRPGQPPEEEKLHDDVYVPQEKVVRVGPPPAPKPSRPGQVMPAQPGAKLTPEPAARPVAPAKPGFKRATHKPVGRPVAHKPRRTKRHRTG